MKLVTLEKAKTFYEEASKAYERLSSFPLKPEKWSEFDHIMECFDKVADLWADLGLDNDNWHKGDRIISEALGTTIRYWDTDIVDQQSFCEDLVEILGYPELTEATEIAEEAK